MTLLTVVQVEHLISRAEASLDRPTSDIGTRLLLGDPLGYAVITPLGEVYDVYLSKDNLITVPWSEGYKVAKLFGVIVNSPEELG